MAGNSLRQAVWTLLGGSTALTEAGYPQDAIYPNFAPDAPTQQRFCVLRWSTVARGIGPVNPASLTVWFYNREPDFAPIMDAIMETRRILPTLEAERLPDGVSAVLGVSWQGDTDDAYDDVYRAWVRTTSHLIVASGN